MVLDVQLQMKITSSTVGLLWKKIFLDLDLGIINTGI